MIIHVIKIKGFDCIEEMMFRRGQKKVFHQTLAHQLIKSTNYATEILGIIDKYVELKIKA